MLRAFLILSLTLASGMPLHASPATSAQFPARAVSRAEAIAGWLGEELSLTSPQKARVRAILDLELCSQASARARGLEIQNAPPIADVRFVDADSLAPSPNRRSRSAKSVLRAARRREAAKEWLAQAGERTELHPKLVGLRVTALDSVLHLLSIDQARRFRELLGGQGMQWIRELAYQRLHPGKSRGPKDRERTQSQEFERAANQRAQAHARANARRGPRAGSGQHRRGGGRPPSNGRGRG
ncbi:MAG: hypothetical protein ACI8QZ_002776 [Chlamydiales bacterium]|jgi:hypothetical protein